MSNRHRSITDSDRIAAHCVAWLIVLLLAALASQLLGFPNSNGDRQAIAEDEFTTPIAAGQVGGTYSTGGQLRAATDAESKASVADGKLSISGGKDTPAAGDPGVWWPAVTRANGLTLRGTINQAATTKIASFGWDAGTSGNVTAGLSTAASAVLNFIDSDARNIGTYAAATDYPMATQAGSSKWFAYLSESGIWKLKYISYLNVSDTTIYPAMSGNTAALTFDNLDVRIRPLPVPLASDSFDRADGALGSTDGKGHAEQNGGGLKTWINNDGLAAIGTNVVFNVNTGGSGLTNRATPYIEFETPNVIACANMYISSTTFQSGFWIRANNHLSEGGSNAIRFGIAPDNTWYIWKLIGGTSSIVASGSATFSNGALIMAICDGSEVRLYYNNAFISANTISDPEILSNTRHGLYIMPRGVCFVKLDNFYVFARGNEGQYTYMGDRR